MNILVARILPDQRHGLLGDREFLDMNGWIFFACTLRCLRGYPEEILKGRFPRLLGAKYHGTL